MFKTVTADDVRSYLKKLSTNRLEEWYAFLTMTLHERDFKALGLKATKTPTSKKKVIKTNK